MEQNNLRRQLGQRLVIYFALAVLIYGALACFFAAPNAKIIYERQNIPVNILVLTDKPMFISYNPKTKKALVINIDNPPENPTIQKIAEQIKIPLGAQPPLILAPLTAKRDIFWDNFKENLTLWHKKPQLIFVYLYDYASLKFKHKTDISFADFTALSMDLASLSAADFSVITQEPPPKPKTQKSRKSNKKEAAQKIKESKKNATLKENAAAKKRNRPLVIEILNATEESGLAAQVTRYIRALANEGELNADVINYASYPSLQKETEIIDLNNRLEDVKQLSLSLGLGDKEIFLRKDANAISDCKIILGKDFRLTQQMKNMDSLSSK